jgi:hypothetical protein
MSVASILAQIDEEIAQLQAARAALSGSPVRKRGGGATTGGRRAFTEAQKAEASKRMKESWAKRKAAAKNPKAKKRVAKKKAVPAS